MAKPTWPGYDDCRTEMNGVLYEWKSHGEQMFDVCSGPSCVASDMTRKEGAALIGLLLCSPQYNSAELRPRQRQGEWVEVRTETSGLS